MKIHEKRERNVFLEIRYDSCRDTKLQFLICHDTMHIEFKVQIGEGKFYRTAKFMMQVTISRREIPTDLRKWESGPCQLYPRAYKIFARPRNLDARTRPTPIKLAGRRASIRQRWIIHRPQSSIVSDPTPRRRHEKCIAGRVHTTR